MATPPSMANEPAASEATPLVATEEVEDWVGVEEPVVTTLVMVVWGPAVVDRLPWTVDETRVDDGTAKVVLVRAVVTAPVLVGLVADSVALSVSDGVAEDDESSPLSSPPPEMVNGKL